MNSMETSDLKIEDVEGDGFVLLPTEELETPLENEPEKFATVLTDTVG